LAGARYRAPAILIGIAMNGMVVRLFFAFVLIIPALPAKAASKNGSNAEADFIKYCAPCHRHDRLGFTAPPLIPGHFSKTNSDKLEQVITDGLAATQMPPFAEILSADRIAALVKYIQTPMENIDWTFKDIVSSKRSIRAEIDPKAKRITDLKDVTMVVERGTRKIAILAGDPPRKFASYFAGAVHGGLKFHHSLENVLSISRDGLVTSFNIRKLSVNAQFKAGVSSRAIAISLDDRYIAVANNLPSSLVIFNAANFAPVHQIKAEGALGGIYSLPGENSFLLSFRDKPELWLIDAKPPFAIRKLATPEPLEDLNISPARTLLIGAKRDGDKMYIVDYKSGDLLATFPAGGFPHLASAAFFSRDGELFAAVNHIKKPEVTIISLDQLKIVARAPIAGAGFFVRTHPFTPYIWAGTATEKIALIDKKDFKTVTYLTPQPGQKAEHVEFNARGNFAMVSIPTTDGAVMIFHSQTLSPVASIPFDTPAGKYNSTNKTFPVLDLRQEGAAAAPPEAGASAGENTLVAADLSGGSVYESACMGCHHQRYEAFGPPFSQIASERNRDQIRTHIQAPASTYKALGYRRNSMPAIPLTSQQLDAVTDYILSFKEE